MTVVDLRPYTRTRSAIMEADFALATAHAKGIMVVKFLHESDRVSELLRRSMRFHKREGRVRFLIPGEKFEPMDQATRYLFDRFPETEQDEDLGKKNKNMTIVFIEP